MIAVLPGLSASVERVRVVTAVTTGVKQIRVLRAQAMVTARFVKTTTGSLGTSASGKVKPAQAAAKMRSVVVDYARKATAAVTMVRYLLAILAQALATVQSAPPATSSQMVCADP